MLWISIGLVAYVYSYVRLVTFRTLAERLVSKRVRPVSTSNTLPVLSATTRCSAQCTSGDWRLRSADWSQEHHQYACLGRHEARLCQSEHDLLCNSVRVQANGQIADMTSRPMVLTSGLVFYVIGYIVVAASQSVQDLAGGEVLYTIGNTGLSFGESPRYQTRDWRLTMGQPSR